MGSRRRLVRLLSTKRSLLQYFGTPLRSYFEPSAQQLEEDGSWMRASRCLHAFNEDFDAGSRVLFTRAIVVPQNIDGILISTVQVLGKTYICGLRLQHSDGPAIGLGYVRPGAETLCTWRTGTRPIGFAGLHLAQGQRGVHGLAIVSSENGLSDWVGEHYNIPKRRLVLVACPSRTMNGITMIEGGFDVIYFRQDRPITPKPK